MSLQTAPAVPASPALDETGSPHLLHHGAGSRSFQALRPHWLSSLPFPQHLDPRWTQGILQKCWSLKEFLKEVTECWLSTNPHSSLADTGTSELSIPVLCSCPKDLQELGPCDTGSGPCGTDPRPLHHLRDGRPHEAVLHVKPHLTHYDSKLRKFTEDIIVLLDLLNQRAGPIDRLLSS